MLYRGGCNFGDEGDGPGSWCGHMLLAVPAMGEEGTAGYIGVGADFVWWCNCA
jgi:hypothetical protein